MTVQIEMSDKLLQIEAQKRQVLGKKVKALRAAGLTPANIIFKGQPSLAIELPSAQLSKALEQIGYTQPVEITVGPDKTTALVIDVSFAPTGDTPEHVVFAEVKKGEQVHASVPLVLVGEAPGTQKGLMVLQMLDHLDVTSPALKIPEQFAIDISGLEEDGDVVRVAEIELPDELETEVDLQTPVVKLEVSRSQVSQAQQEDAEAGEAADGETEAGADGKATDGAAETEGQS